ncbi:hypothetical protein [Pseudomonas typographi]|uniref:Uncharacterized protein n=1 Tax=Pseudomonas typographi TaxID=2715964 RepID=A0ABR7YX82_9PSED|nr:hypothetical protein [Pseudomonas typographi]MBD1551203.1 hypothetical protein [Pseudomonas typographi]MBD1586303.1 hypothetical protein [Pseudomonas typographi]MBD1597775.1 hypothetical protein [Pseudomonas typographi]
MQREERDALELERLIAEARKLNAEARKLVAEERKYRRDAVFYPLFVGAAILTAIAAMARFLLHPLT